MDLPDSDWGDFSCRRAVDSSSFKYAIFQHHDWNNFTEILAFSMRLPSGECHSPDLTDDEFK